ncbi:MAG: MOSC domain-containing protein [Pedobacter sp.]|nr:MOSC domain-containing protein [Pedobacter sp.]
MKNISISSINILGKPELLVSDHQKAYSAYRKQAISADSIELGMTGFAGDIIVDTKHHGGNDKAICCYNSDHFKKWKAELGFDLDAAAFGENLTLSGQNANEEHIFIGDRYQLGEAIVEVSEPRGPCYMIGIRYNYKQFPIHLQQTGLTGYYFRTIKTGLVKKTDKLIHLSSHPEKISVMNVNYVRYHDPENKEWLQRLVNLKELTLEWRERFEKMLSKL